MRNKFIILTLAIAAVFAACSPNEPDVFSGKDTAVMFDKNAALTIKENAGIYKIPVVVAGLPGKTNYKVSITATDSTAVEGVDFNILTSELNFTEGYGIDTVRISIIDNDVFEGDKVFQISLTSDNIALGSNVSVYVTIVDNEHPLAIVLGSYLGADFDLDGVQDGGNYPVSISSIPGSISQVSILNFWGGGDFSIIADVDPDAQTISILPGQVIYIDEIYGYGECKAVRIDLEEMAYDFTNPISGSFDAEGNIEFEAWAAVVQVGDQFGHFALMSKTTLTKQ